MDDSVQELELDAIAPGTVLASDLLESSGKVLVMAGTALTQKCSKRYAARESRGYA